MTATLWWLLQNLLTVSVLLPFVCIACRLLRNRPAVQHALWLVVLVRLVTPPVVSWSLSAIGEVGWQYAAEGVRPARAASNRTDPNLFEEPNFALSFDARAHGYCVLLNSGVEDWKHEVTGNHSLEPSG
jgi:hypothetical protein